MKLTKIFAAAAVALATIGTAQADPTITNVDGTLSPFGGFDWASGSAAFTTGFTGVVGSTFTMNYAGWAVALNDTGSGTLYTPKLDTNPNGTPITSGAYEYTIFAAIQEKVVSCGATSCVFQVLNGGTFDIYYDTAANAKTAKAGAWSGFKDGTKIVSGTVGASAGQTFDDSTGGQVALTGSVTFTNGTYINPALVGSNFTSTLQLASAQTTFSTPTSIDGSAVNAGQIVFQADANQTFTTNVPEPAGLALVGLALAGCGLVSRRRKSA
jgi:hypothetical protein